MYRLVKLYSFQFLDKLWKINGAFILNTKCNRFRINGSSTIFSSYTEYQSESNNEIPDLIFVSVGLYYLRV